VTRFGYIINAMREAFAGHYFNTIMVEGISMSIGTATICLWLASRASIKEGA